MSRSRRDPAEDQRSLSLNQEDPAADLDLNGASDDADDDSVATTAEPATRKAASTKRRATAETMAAQQREISVSEFFTKNRHLLGFDNPAKSLLTAIKEAVDNSLDACEEAGILPDLSVEVDEVAEGRFRVAVQDNGPGIVRAQVPKVFAKLLYGSKFHRLKQSRGQQGIGISAAVLYAQLTTGKPVVIVSKTDPGTMARRIELRIETRQNKPEVLSDTQLDWPEVDHGTRVELELSGTYRGGRTSIDSYLEQTAIANPHMSLVYRLPRMDKPIVLARATQELPREPLEIKPHPHGVELGLLIRMMLESRGQTVKKTLVESFSRVSASVADQVCEIAEVGPNEKSHRLDTEQIEALHRALATVKVLAPPASCVVPIGEDLIIAGLKRRFQADFYTAVTRPPAVYRGNPFVVECGIAHGGNLDRENPAEIMRFANRVPLQYQPKACATTEAVYQTNWKAYELTQPKGSLPIGPVAVVLHLASVWVPFTSEAKEAVAHYPELLKELKLAIQEAGRKLATHLRARHKSESELKRKNLFERYIPELGQSLAKIANRDPMYVIQSLHDALPSFVNTELAEQNTEEGASDAQTGTSQEDSDGDANGGRDGSSGDESPTNPQQELLEPEPEPPSQKSPSNKMRAKTSSRTARKPAKKS
ncbi:MAG: DNA topoisomerase VI subunit B [Polyangiaceae bacterium]|nr:DNA topoisomerase VI subunit B [Polyangiaceae bacterium]